MGGRGGDSDVGVLVGAGSEQLLDLTLHGRDGVLGRAEASHGDTLLVDHELGEVPLDRAEDENNLELINAGVIAS